MARRHKRRRGIVILVVLSLLVLFTLLVATYVIVSGQYERAARAVATEEILRVNPEKDADKAFYQILRGSDIRNSAARFHSLLRDYCGEDGFRGRLAGTQLLQVWNTDGQNPDAGYRWSGGQFLDLLVDVNTQPRSTDDQEYTISRTSGYYNGCVLTITGGEAQGLSTRIVGYSVATRTINNASVSFPVFRVLGLKADDGTSVSWAGLGNAPFIVNGRPFNGTGFGYQASSGPGTPSDLHGTIPAVAAGASVNVMAALVPNYSGRVIVQPWNPSAGLSMQSGYRTLLGGGSDEGYDAPDTQNMFLAMVTAGAASSADIIPSFHRPALINYWMNASSGGYGVNDDFKRYISLRPVEWNFDGSNPSYDPVNGPWDVDNDGDGIPDSVWVDLGLPVQTAPDGRKYKPLFAILCVDLDGRLNVNAHGRVARVTPADVSVVGNNTGNSINASTFSKGLGYGPPEINLAGTGITGNLNGLLTARYGADGRPGIAGYDILAQLKSFEEPRNYFWPLGGRSSYSSPSDLRAELAFGLDDLGQPTFQRLFDPSVVPPNPQPPEVIESRMDSPYELNLLKHIAADSPYTAADLERVLRRFDYDISMLPDRLSSYISNLRNGPNARIVTTASFDPPVPGVVVPAELAGAVENEIRNPSGTGQTNVNLHLSHAGCFMDLLKARLDTTVLSTASDIERELGKMVSPDLMMGLRMDLNRPLGNGRNESTLLQHFPDPNNPNDPPPPAGFEQVWRGVGLVDEMALPYLPNNPLHNPELLNPLVYSNVGTVRSQFQNVQVWHTNGIDVDGDGTIDTPFQDTDGDGTPDIFPEWDDRLRTRQLMARHLYVLMMTLIDHGNAVPQVNATYLALANQVAQWAINVVDFRDADSIMTAFEYDTYPFNGWTVDGNLTTNEGAERGVVWGCERPELLLTEALAFHARNTEDLDDPDKRTDDQNDPDEDYDQVERPFGTAFVEIFNPWTGTDTKTTPPWEFYENTYGGVKLNRFASDRIFNQNTGQFERGTPVWRMLIIYGGIADRAVYFVDDITDAPAADDEHGKKRFYLDDVVADIAPILPGRYAVVGGGKDDGGGNGVSWIAQTQAQQQLDERRIKLTPDQNPDTNNQVSVYNSNGVRIPLPQPAVGIFVNKSDGAAMTFSVSEPRDGYPGVLPPADEPFDKSGDYADEVAKKNGTTRAFCRVRLQRLANPLVGWHKDTNPYLTIDSIPMDLTAYNGREKFPLRRHEDGPNNYDPNKPSNRYVDNELGPPTDPDVPNATTLPREPDVGDLLPEGNTNTDFSCVERGDNDAFKLLWRQQPVRAGALNQDVDVNSLIDTFFPFALTHTLGKENTDYQSITNLTYPWLVWNNRPFVSPYELLHVSSYDCSELLDENRFSISNGNPYSGTPQYGYLPNYFGSTVGAHRIFDYVHVPSRFVGTETVLNPDYFGKNTNFTQPTWVSSGFLPPFNRVSMYRDPGRVNINTITSPTVWDAIRGSGGPSFSEIVLSRQFLAPNPSYPTYFHDPFRPAGSPLPPGQPGGADVQTTLLRGVPPSNPTKPLMEVTLGATPPPLARHPRNSFFRYEKLHRLGNMITTRSNVYAIWITVGYFEVEPNGNMVVDNFHPDGLRVGQEIGIDTGEIRRHRAFYMVDRTIPVAFQPGENHNVDKCVLLRRFIE